MMGEFYVEKFVQKREDEENRFGIKTSELGETWINGFGQCPQVIKENETNKIPYHEVKKGDKTYYNYGAPKPNLQAQIDELREELRLLKDELRKN